jgi:exopolysaccharide production protein ExoY
MPEYILCEVLVSGVVGFRRDFVVKASFATAPVGLGIKRIIDVLLASGAILLLAPLLVLCFVTLALSSPGPVFFRHRRVGFKGKYFGCLKFRTMVPNADDCLRAYLLSNPQASAEWAATQKLRYDPRVTALGAILRRTSLDELPQLFNVLIGDMSIVGPRPVTDDELAKYASFTGSYLSCRPGITGLWQVSGRSKTTYGRRVACDAFYARNWSLALDLKIMIATLPALLQSESAY